MKLALHLISIVLLNFGISAQNNIDVSIDLSKQNQDYILLLDQPNTSTKHISGKSKKGHYVYDMLQKNIDAQTSIITWLKNNNVFFESFYIANAIRVKSTTETLLQLSKLPQVKRVLKNVNLSIDTPHGGDSYSSRNPLPEWGLIDIKADSVWQMGHEGQNVVIGGQDTGYDWKVSPLKQKYRGWISDSTSIHNYHWHDAIHDKSPLSADSLNPCGFNLKEPCDDNNHGTHTMGTMVGSDTANTIGVAPAARWIACRNMERGNGQLSTYLECFEWFLAPTDIDGSNPDVDQAPHVINNSWYCNEPEGCNLNNWEPLRIAIQNLKNAGVVVVVSAGNSGPNCNTISYSPAVFEESFAVGASNIANEIAGFSSRGTVSIDSSYRIKPNVTAPGVNVRSVVRGGSFANFSGTSMAGPHVAGTVALMISANPLIAGEVEAIEDILQKTARPKYADQNCYNISGQSLPNPIFGYGIIDALAAVHQAKGFALTAVPQDVNTSKEILIYPNPIHDVCTIISTRARGDLQDIHIYDIEGRLYFQSQFSDKIDINMSSMIPQLYVIKISTHTSVHFAKVVKL